MKIFIYLDDVDENTGPLDYVPASTLGSHSPNEWPWRPVSNDLYPPHGRVRATGSEVGPGVADGARGLDGLLQHERLSPRRLRDRVEATRDGDHNYSSPASLAASTLRNFSPEVSRIVSEQAAFALN